MFKTLYGCVWFVSRQIVVNITCVCPGVCKGEGAYNVNYRKIEHAALNLDDDVR